MRSKRFIELLIDLLASRPLRPPPLFSVGFHSTPAPLQPPSIPPVSPPAQTAIGEVAKSLLLDLTQQQQEKIWQLHLACEQRIGVIIVGPSGKWGRV